MSETPAISNCVFETAFGSLQFSREKMRSNGVDFVFNLYMVCLKAY